MYDKKSLDYLVENARRNRENPLTPGTRVANIMEGGRKGTVIAPSKNRGAVIVRFDEDGREVGILTFALRRIENDKEA